MKDKRKSAAKTAFWVILAAVLCCAVLSACTMTRPDESGKEEPTPPIVATPFPTAELPEQTAVPAPAPPPPEVPEDASGLVPEDPLAFLLGFADAEIVSIYDESFKEYAISDRSFAEIISAETWTAHVYNEFPASIAERLIIMRNEDWQLRIEDDGEDCLYAAYAVGRGDSDPIIYFECGENLMDALMSWAIAQQAGQNGAN